MTYVKGDIDDDTHRELRVWAAEKGVPIDEVVADCVEFAVEHRLAGANPTTQPTNDE